MSEPRPSGFVWAVFVGVAVLVAIYVGSYYAVVDRYWGSTQTFAVYSSNPTVSRFVDPLFWPMNSLDRHLRPDIWEASAEDPALQNLESDLDSADTNTVEIPMGAGPAVDVMTEPPSVESPVATDRPNASDPTP